MKRLHVLGIMFTIVLLGLSCRLYFVQIYDQNEYMEIMARQSRIILAGLDRRGTIYDRDQNPLTNSEEEFIYLIEKRLMDERITGLLEEAEAEHSTSANQKYVVYRGPAIDNEAVKELEKEYGIFVINAERRYKGDQLAVHLLGHINSSDNTGASGIEKQYDDLLSKEGRVVWFTADAKGYILPGFGIHVEADGETCGVITTIDSGIQKKAEDILQENNVKGSMIVLEVSTGEVLGSASTPAYNPYALEDYLDSREGEMINKSLQGQYAPGSVFKLAVAAAALESGEVTPETVFHCPGYGEIDGVRIGCSTGGTEGHGDITFAEAFEQSCNSAFIEVGSMIGGDAIIDMAESLGYGDFTLKDFPEEKKGLLPDESDYQGAGIGNLSIGQGKLLATPMQVAKSTQIIANRGMDTGLSLVKATLVEGEETPVKPASRKQVISSKTAAQLMIMMTGTMQQGTGNNLSSEFSAGGKTGSAESTMGGVDVVHGWFTGFYPADNPQYVVTVFVENGGSGRSSAIPLFEEMLGYLKQIKN